MEKEIDEINKDYIIYAECMLDCPGYKSSSRDRDCMEDCISSNLDHIKIDDFIDNYPNESKSLLGLEFNKCSVIISHGEPEENIRNCLNDFINENS